MRCFCSLTDALVSRTARRVLLKGEDVAARGVAASLLRNVSLNLWGLGATIVGLQVHPSAHT